MTLNMYGLRDKLNGFITPIPFPNDETAKRYFMEQKESNITIKLSPADFELYKMGEFDTESGIFKSKVTMMERG